MLLRDIKGLVLKDFKLIDLFIFKSLNSNVSLINEVGFYISNSGGKRLRPLLLLLMSKVCGYKGNLHIPLSVVIEFIHTSTLLHDDVVDSSLNRRGNLTVNTCWGNQIAVLVGDFLYSKAFQIMVRSGDLDVLRLLSNSTNKIAEGEVLQLLCQHSVTLDEKDYFEIIEYKTACLFYTATLIGTIISKEKKNLQLASYNYGMHFGRAYQLVDDVLDYTKGISTSGKDLGDDLFSGKVTLPIIYLFNSVGRDCKSLIIEIFRFSSVDKFLDLQFLLKKSNALEYTLENSKNELLKAKFYLSKFPNSKYLDACSELLDFIDRRCY